MSSSINFLQIYLDEIIDLFNPNNNQLPIRENHVIINVFH